MVDWAVAYTRVAKKQYEQLKRCGSRKPSMIDAIDFLSLDLQKNGPYLPSWSNYSPLGKNQYHCHLRKKRPTYVACWRVIDKKNKKIEVYYVGTHEKAPY